MTSVLGATRSLLLLSSITLWACSDQMAIHQLVLAEGETEGTGFCATLSDVGTTGGGGGVNGCDSDDDYRQSFMMGDGHAKFSFLILRDLGDEAEKQVGGLGPNGEHCVLALDIAIDQDHFAHGARRDSFATREGVEHAVYTWAEADCEESGSSVPQWVLDKVAAP